MLDHPPTRLRRNLFQTDGSDGGSTGDIMANSSSQHSLSSPSSVAGTRFVRDEGRRSQPPETTPYKSFYASEYMSGDTQPLESMSAPPLETPGLSRFKTMDDSINALPTFNLFVPPRTPNLAGYKRRSNGELVSDSVSAKQYPGITISLSQAFKNTQVDTSPFPNHTRSDPVFDRPSPQFQHQMSSPTSPFFRNRMQPSSPMLQGQENQVASTSPTRVQVPRSSKNTDQETGMDVINRNELPIVAQAMAAPQTTARDVTSDSQIPTQLLDRIPDSQVHFSPLPLSDEKKILGSESQAALITSTPIRPPHSSPPRLSGHEPEIAGSEAHNPSRSVPAACLRSEYIMQPAGLASSAEDTASSQAKEHIDLTPNSMHRNQKRRRLAEISAEHSQSQLNDFNLHFEQPHTEAEKAYDEYMSGSSPVSRKSRERLTEHSKQSLANSSFSSINQNGGVQTDNVPEPTRALSVDHTDLPFSMSINSARTPKDATLHSTGSLSRPKKFLGHINRKRQSKAIQSSAQKTKLDVFDVEESQMENQAAISAPILSMVQKPPLIKTQSKPKPIQTTTPVIKEKYPNRIFAYWPSDKTWYPGTCLSTLDENSSAPKLDVVFDEGSRAIVPVSKQNFKLQLRPGDVVRVSLKNLNKKRYVVSALKDLFTEPGTVMDDSDTPLVPRTDIYGHQVAVLTTKGRDSMPGSTESTVTIEVPISAIKLSEVYKFEDRRYDSILDPVLTGNSRLLSSTPKAPEASASPKLPNATTAVDSAMFSGMAFAVSLGSDKLRHRLSDLVKSHAGAVIEDGFDSLFEPYSLPLDGEVENDFASYLVPLKQHQTMGFVALIADDYSRKTKYMQALSLNLPILHFRWIEDCLSGGKVLPWVKYLLPAGKSSYLYDAVRSRTLQPYVPLGDAASFVEVLKRRSLIFQGKSILFIRNRNAQTDEMRKTCMFLSAAMGATRIKAVADLTEANHETTKNEWNFVYGHEHAKTRATLKTGQWQMLARETIIQSLILGDYCPP